MTLERQKKGLLYRLRMSAGWLLVLGLTASCNGLPLMTDYQVVNVPMAQKPTIHKEPSLTILKTPVPQIVTLEEFKYYYDACEAYESVGQEGFADLKEVQATYKGITEQDACSFAVYGFPTQIWLGFEAQLIEAAGHKEQWVNLARNYARALVEQYVIYKEAADKIEFQITKKKDK